MSMQTTRRDETGVVTLWLVFMTVAALAVAGLVIDGGYALAARRDAARIAEQAARTGADQLDTDSLRTGGSDLRRDAARAAATRYLSGVDADGRADVNGDTVTVTVTKTTKSVILGAFGLDGLTVTSTATARSIDEQGAGP